MGIKYYNGSAIVRMCAVLHTKCTVFQRSLSLSCLVTPDNPRLYVQLLPVMRCAGRQEEDGIESIFWPKYVTAKAYNWVEQGVKTDHSLPACQ